MDYVDEHSALKCMIILTLDICKSYLEKVPSLLTEELGYKYYF